MQAVGPTGLTVLGSLKLLQKWLKFQILVCEASRAQTVMCLIACWEQAHRFKLEKLKGLIYGGSEDKFAMMNNASCFLRWAPEYRLVTEETKILSWLQKLVECNEMNQTDHELQAGTC